MNPVGTDNEIRNDESQLASHAEPHDQRLNVVHRSEEGMLAYRATNRANA